MGADVCQSFFSGCEAFIDKTLQGALRTVDDLETKAQSLSDIAMDNLVSIRHLSFGLILTIRCLDRSAVAQLVEH